MYKHATYKIVLNKILCASLSVSCYSKHYLMSIVVLL